MASVKADGVTITLNREEVLDLGAVLGCFAPGFLGGLRSKLEDAVQEELGVDRYVYLDHHTVLGTLTVEDSGFDQWRLDVGIDAEHVILDPKARKESA